jgi:hypothetical protein
MVSYHRDIRNLLDDEWKKKKVNDYYIFLEKDGVCRKIVLNSGKIISEEKIVSEKKQSPS